MGLLGDRPHSEADPLERSDDEDELQQETGMLQRRRQRKPSKQCSDEQADSHVAKRQCIKAEDDETTQVAATTAKAEEDGATGNSYGLRTRSGQRLHADDINVLAAAGMEQQLTDEEHAHQGLEVFGMSATGAGAAGLVVPITINDVRGMLISHCGRSVSESTMPVIKMLSRCAGGSVDLKVLFSRALFQQLMKQMNEPDGVSYNLKPMSKYTYMSALMRVLDLPSVQRLFVTSAEQEQLDALRDDIDNAKRDFMRAADSARKSGKAKPSSTGGSSKQQRRLQQQQQDELQRQQGKKLQWLVSAQDRVAANEGNAAALADATAAVAALTAEQVAAAMAKATVAAADAVSDAQAAAAAAAPAADVAETAADASDATAAGGADAGAASDGGSNLRRSRRQQQLAEGELLLMEQQRHAQEDEEEDDDSVQPPAVLRTVADLKQLLTYVKGSDKVSQQSVCTLLSPVKSWSAACGGCTDLRMLFVGRESGKGGRRGGFDGMLQLLQSRVGKDELSPATASMHMYSLLAVLQLDQVREQVFTSDEEWQVMRARVDAAKKEFLALDKAAKAAAAGDEHYVPWQQKKRRKGRNNNSSSHLMAAASYGGQQHQKWTAVPVAVDDNSDEEAAAVLASLATSDAQAAGQQQQPQQTTALRAALPQLLQQLSAREGRQEQQYLQQGTRTTVKSDAAAAVAAPRAAAVIPHEQQQQQIIAGGIATGPSSPAEADSVKSSWLVDGSRQQPSGSHHGPMPAPAAAAAVAATAAATAPAAAGHDSSGGYGLLNEAESCLMQLVCQLQPDKDLRCVLLQRLDDAMLMLRGLVTAGDSSADGGGGDADASALLLNFRTDYMRVCIWRDNGMAAAAVMDALERLINNTLTALDQYQQQ